MKTKLLSFLLLIPIILIGGVLIAPSFIDWNSYKPQIIEQVKGKTGFDLDLKGDISLALLPLPTVKIQDVHIQNKGKTLVSLESVGVSVALLPLLSKKIEVEDIELVHPTIDLVIDKNGQGNWSNEILASSEKPDAENTPEQKTEQKTEQKNTSESSVSALSDFSIDDFKITDGLLNFGNAQTGQHYKIEAINIDAEMDSLQGPFEGDVFFKYNGQSYDISGEVTSIEDVSNIPVVLNLALDGGEAIASFKGGINTQDYSTAGAFALKGSDISHYVGEKAKGPFEASGNIHYSKTRIQLEDFSAALAGLKFEGVIVNEKDSIALTLKEITNGGGQGDLGALLSGARINADILMGKEQIAFPRYDLVLRGDTLKGEGSYHFSDGVQLDLETPSLNIDEWMGLAERGKSQPSPSSAPAEKAVAHKKPLTGFSLPVPADISVNVGALTYQGQTYKNVALDLSSKKNTMLIKNITLNADHDTQIALRGKIGNTQTLRGLDLKASLKTADADSLLKSLAIGRDAYPQTIGALDVDMAVTGSLDVLNFSTKIGNKGLTLTANGHAKDPLETKGARSVSDLNLRLQHANLVNAVKIAQPDFSMDRAWQKPLDLTLALSLSGDTLSVTSVKGKAGLLPVESGALTIQTKTKKPVISGSLALGVVELPHSKTHNKGQTTSSGGASSASKGSKWSSTPIDTAWMNAVTADLTLSAKKIIQNRWVFDSPTLDLSVKDGVLSVPALKADMFNGSALVSGKAVSGQNGKGFSSVQLKADTKNLNARSLYSAIKGKSTTMITGAIVQASEQMTTQGISMAALVQNLTGDANIKGERLVIHGVDVTNFVRAINGDFRGLNSLADISSSVLYKGKTEFDTLNGQFDVTQGVVSLNPVTLDGPKAIFDVTGALDLPQWTIDINNKVTPKGTGSQELESFDMSFRGSLDNPVKSAGGGALENIVQRKLKGLLGDKDLTDKLNNKLGIDLFGGAKDTPHGEPATEPASGESGEESHTAKPATPEDALKGAIGGFLEGL